MVVPESGWLTAKQAAAYMNRSVTTLKRWRKQKKGPPFARFDGRPSYLRSRIDEWVDAHADDYESPSKRS